MPRADTGKRQENVAVFAAADEHLAAIDSESLHTVLGIGDQAMHGL